MVAAASDILKTGLMRFLRHGLVGNALSLYAVQGLNYLLPLLLFPYLLRVLGPQGYGSIVFAQALMAYAAIVTDFGFNLTAARDISVARDDPQAVARIYWTTMTAKALLLVACAFVVAIVILAVPALRHNWPVTVLSGALVIGSMAFPQWYFQGLERLKEAAAIQAVSKVLYTLCAVVLIRSSGDLLIAAFLMSAQQLFSVATAAIMRRRIAPEFYRPTFKEVRLALASSRHLFMVQASATLYGNTNAFVLGLMNGETAVAIYSLGQRVVAILQSLSVPVTQALFPRTSLLFSQQPEQAWKLIGKVAKLILPAMALACLLVGIFAPQIVAVLGGASYSGAASTLRIMAVVPLLVTLATMLNQCVMINNGLTGQMVRMYATVGVLNVLLLPLLIMKLEAGGAALSLTIAEGLMAVLLIRMVWTRRKALGWR